MSRAVVLLEDGRRFVGRGFGAVATHVGEVVFHTAMTGYQEILTDPSFTEQIVTMTAPHIGNTGINTEDGESGGIAAAGLIVRKVCRVPSNWRSTTDLPSWLAERGVPGVEGVDTRALVRHIRDQGAMRAAISTEDRDDASLMNELLAWPGMAGRALAPEVTCRHPYVLQEGPGLRIHVVDGGVKTNILRLLKHTDATIVVHPLTGTAASWRRDADLVLFTNGPGDPAALPAVVEQVRQLVGTVPTAGICLGHQLLALALGASTYKLPFGHRGGNQPVRDERTGEVLITSQNHGFAVDGVSLQQTGAQITHTHLNDQTVSGFQHAEQRVFGVQFHPEAAPGPHDAHGLLDAFLSFARTPPCP